MSEFIRAALGRVRNVSLHPVQKHEIYNEILANVEIVLCICVFIIIMMNVRTYQSLARWSEKCVITCAVNSYEIFGETPANF